jgi:hypothetical protein
MPRVVACYSLYNEIEFIEASLRSVLNLVDYVVAVDGAYSDWPDKHDHSYDGTTELVKQLVGCNGIVISPLHRTTQDGKRNVYVKYVEQKFGDAWLFVVDGDEILRDAENDFRWLRSRDAEKYNVAQLPVRNEYEPEEQSRLLTRLYRMVPGLHYRGDHLNVRDANDNVVEENYPTATLTEAWIDHRRFLRNSDRKALRDKYYNRRGVPRWHPHRNNS